MIIDIRVLPGLTLWARRPTDRTCHEEQAMTSQPECDRFWLLTWTTYGSWLPGDPRGFVSHVRDGQGPRVRHNTPGTDFDADIPQLEKSAEQSLKGKPVRLQPVHAEALLAQFHETARFRGWRLFAVAIMANHVHVVLGVPGDPEPDGLLKDLKSYGSRALNRQFGKPVAGTWWTKSGSRRVLKKEDDVLAAVRYVRDQEFPLIIWIDREIGPELAKRP